MKMVANESEIASLSDAFFWLMEQELFQLEQLAVHNGRDDKTVAYQLRIVKVVIPWVMHQYEQDSKSLHYVGRLPRVVKDYSGDVDRWLKEKTMTYQEKLDEGWL